MRKLKPLMLLFAMCAFALSTFAQQSVTVSGSVKNSMSKEAVSAVSVTIKGTSYGTFTDDKGDFKITTAQKLPFTLVFSSVGYADKEVSVTTNNQVINVEFETKFAMGEEVVVAASRVAEKILESPVSIERMGQSAIKNAAVPNYYDALANFKGVDLTTSSINFRTLSTRGFNGSGNLRLNQLIDGMDNQAPALNFSVGSIIGLTELDVDNAELLQGASSALYGSGGMNGTLLLTSKSPFKYQGLSFQIKQGINHVDKAQRSAAPFYDWSMRWGKKISEKFAFKISAQMTQAQDWQASDATNLLRNNVLSKTTGGTRDTDPNYDGVNVYGDEVSQNMQYLARLGLASNFGALVASGAITPAQVTAISGGLNSIASLGLPYANSLAAVNGTPSLAPFAAFFPTVFSINRGYYNQSVSRTGYDEKDLANYNAYNVKLSGGLYYKINDKIEASILGYWGIGTTVYTGIDRYSLKNFKLGQYKAEVKAKNWFLRAYTTQENSGDSYANTITAVQMDRMWKSDGNWFSQYLTTYTGAMLSSGGNTVASNAAARTAADAGRYLPGSQAFKDAFNTVTGTSITNNGGLFADKSGMYHFEGQYNLADKIKVVDLLVGASYRIYHLNSGSTIFADNNAAFGTGNINIKEYGGYLQLGKKLLNDVLKLTGTIRYDKNENFEGRFTPRLTASVKVAKDNNIRLSYQTAYRFPSTQDQWINLNSPSATLVGALPIFNTVYNFSGNPIYTAESINAYRAKFTATGTPDPTVLVKGSFNSIKPESVQSYEIGYRGVIAKKLLVDAYYYYSSYKNFLGKVAVGRGNNGAASYATDLLSPTSTTNYSFAYNTTDPVKATGWGVSAEYQLPANFTVNANVSGDELKDVQAGVVSFFNTPKIRYNLGLGNTNLFKTNWGFNIMYRWQDKVDWEGTFGSGQIPSYGTVDAQLSYRFVKEKGLLKFGAQNLWNKYYRSAFGNPKVGGLYYVSYGFNL